MWCNSPGTKGEPLGSFTACCVTYSCLWLKSSEQCSASVFVRSLWDQSCSHNHDQPPLVVQCAACSHHRLSKAHFKRCAWTCYSGQWRKVQCHDTISVHCSMSTCLWGLTFGGELVCIPANWMSCYIYFCNHFAIQNGYTDNTDIKVTLVYSSLPQREWTQQGWCFFVCLHVECCCIVKYCHLLSNIQSVCDYFCPWIPHTTRTEGGQTCSHPVHKALKSLCGFTYSAECVKIVYEFTVTSPFQCCIVVKGHPVVH